MASIINVKVLRKLSPKALGVHFQSLRFKGLNETQTSTRLLKAVKTGSLSPVEVMPVWLSFVKTPHGKLAVSSQPLLTHDISVNLHLAFDIPG